MIVKNVLFDFNRQNIRQNFHFFSVFKTCYRFRDELEVHAHLNEKPLELATRNQIDLHRILEDQWRKDLHDNNPELNLESSLNSTPVGSDRK